MPSESEQRRTRSLEESAKRERHITKLTIAWRGWKMNLWTDTLDTSEKYATSFVHVSIIKSYTKHEESVSRSFIFIFISAARKSHGLQWSGRFYYEREKKMKFP
jgi:hypothetical protein